MRSLRRLSVAAVASSLALLTPPTLLAARPPGALVDPHAGLTWWADAAHALRAGLTDRLVVPRIEGAAWLRAFNASQVDSSRRHDWRLPTEAELARRLSFGRAARAGAPPQTDAALLADVLRQVQAGRGDLVALVPVRGGLIPPGFPDVVVFAANSIHIKNDSVILSGNVVANDAGAGPTLAGAELVIGPRASSSTTSALKADSVRVKPETQVGGDVHYNDLTNQGTIGGLLVTPLALPVFAGTPPFKTGTPGTSDVVVLPKDTLTLPPGAYRHLDARHDATVFFTGGVYDFESVRLESDVTLLFDAASDVRVAGRFESGPDTLIAPSPGALISAADVVFFVAGGDGEGPALDSTAQAAEVGPRNYVRANFYVPNGTLQLKNGTNALGAFLGHDVEIGPHATLALQSAFFNRAPVAVPDSATVESHGTVTVLDSGATSLLANDSDPNGDLLTLTTTPVSGPSFGTLTLAPDGTFSYTHDGSDASGDVFVYEVCDEGVPVLCATATVTITILTPPYDVTVTKAGSGTGQVVSAPAGIDCGPTCSASFAAFTPVTLTATPDPGSFFMGFTGGPGCAGGVVNGPPDVACVARFDVFVPVTLTVEKAGSGSGHVGSDPAGIDCGPTCAAVFPRFTRVELAALAEPGSFFVGFGGDPDCADGFVALEVSKTCTAVFDLAPPPPASSVLTLVPLGSGTGTVTSRPAGIVCGADCRSTFADGTTVLLIARPDPDARFTGWGGDCAGTSFSTSVTIGPDKTCTATFEAL